MIDNNKFVSLPLKTLQEINRQAEALLNAQLQCGLAADQRALALSGLFMTGAVVIAGSGVASFTDADIANFVGWVALTVSVSLLIAAGIAIWSARPVDFYFPGSDPEDWKDDIEKQVELNVSLASCAALDSNAINKNNDILSKNGQLLRLSLAVGWLSLLAGAISLAYHYLG